MPFKFLKSSKPDTSQQDTQSSTPTNTTNNNDYLNPDPIGDSAPPRRRSLYEKWKSLTNPQATFSDEEIQRRTGGRIRSADELERFVAEPGSMEEARKYWPSDLAWAFGGATPYTPRDR